MACMTPVVQTGYCLVWVPQDVVFSAALCNASMSEPAPTCIATSKRGAKRGTRGGHANKGNVSKDHKGLQESSDGSTCASPRSSASSTVDDWPSRCAAWIASLEGGAAARASVLEELRGRICGLAFDKCGCRVVQAALRVAGHRDALALAEELRGSIWQAAKCQHANYVVQKLVQLLPTSATGFIASELLGRALELARNECACRVLCRLVEHGPAEPEGARAALWDEVLGACGELLLHRFGHHVLQALLEHGSERQRRPIMEALQEKLLEVAEHRCGAYVLEKALIFGARVEQWALASELLVDENRFSAFASSLAGYRVAAALLRLPLEESARRARQLSTAHASSLRSTKYGRRLLEELKRCEGAMA